jgi:hypothetical protein
MADDPAQGDAPAPPRSRDDDDQAQAAAESAFGGEIPRDENGRERPEWGLSDLVRRAVSAGVGAASRGKDDVMRVATTEIRSWLDRLELDSEIVRALTKMTIEVKTEIRFRPTEDGKVVPEAVNDVKVKK